MTDTDLIVVGVDGSAGSRHALRWAVEEAGRTDGTVRAITTWSFEGGMMPVTTPNQRQDWAEHVSARDVDRVAADAGVPVLREVTEGVAVTVLVEASRDARLLVLGGHGYGRLHRAVLGSTSEACVRRATCPVVIVPAAQHAPVPAA